MEVLPQHSGRALGADLQAADGVVQPGVEGRWIPVVPLTQRDTADAAGTGRDESGIAPPVALAGGDDLGDSVPGADAVGLEPERGPARVGGGMMR